MPDAATHSAITRAALQLQPFDTGDNSRLIDDYSSWPDRYFSERRAEIMPYMFFLDGIQFHYPPDTPYTELYRYWDMDENSNFHRSRPAVNENFRHVTAGFRFYLEHILEHFARREMEEGKKYLGCLIHMLQDSTFGLHALEGAGGSDAFVLDRLTGAEPAPSAILGRLRYRDDFAVPGHQPRSLGNSVEETVMRLYAEYCRVSADSRQCVFRYVMNTLENRAERNFAEEQRMFHNAVKLTADTIWTVYRIARGEIGPVRSCRLEELEPYQFPFGGFGGYRFRSFLRNKAVDREGKTLPLELDRGRFEHGLSFGTHLEGTLLYSVAPKVFSRFTCRIGLHAAFPAAGKVQLTWISHGRETETFTLDPDCRSRMVDLPDPGGEFGLKFRSDPTCGVLVLADPLLLPQS